MTTDWLSLLAEHTARFAQAIDGADLDARVTHCPDWTVHDLAVHLGGVHQWAAHAVTAGTPDGEPVPPSSRADLASWYAGSAAALLDVLTAAPADAPAWTLDRTDPTVGFWRRRQVHETVLHTWDLQQALGAAEPVDPGLAWDGVLEVVEVMYPRQVRLGRVAPLATAYTLVACDTGDRVALGEGDPVEVAAPAETLLRLLWHRVDAHDADPAAAGLLSQAVTP